MNIFRTRFFSLCLLFFASTVHTMDTVHKKKKFFTAQRLSSAFAKGMRRFHVGVFFAVTLGPLITQCVGIANTIKTFEKNKVGPLSQQFIEKTFKDHGYPASMMRNVTCINSKKYNGFYVMWVYPRYLIVPFDDGQLKKAYDLHNGKMLPSSFDNNNTNDAFRKKMLRIGVDNADENNALRIPQKEYENIVTMFKEECGIAATPHTLHVWQGFLLHEGSHLLHQDSLKKGLAALCVPFVIHSATKRASAALLLPPKSVLGNIARGLGSMYSLPLKLFLSHLMVLSVGKYQEYRADQDAIARSKNPDILNAMSFNMKNHGMWNQYAMQKNVETMSPQVKKILSHPLLKEFQDEHPRDEVRAHYFEKAAQKLRQQP